MISERVRQKETAKQILKNNLGFMTIVFVCSIIPSIIVTNEAETYIYPVYGILINLGLFLIKSIMTFIIAHCTVYATKKGDTFRFSDINLAVDWELLGSFIYLDFIITLKVVLWALLFVIPGFIKACEYGLIYYDFVENPHLRLNDYFERARMMQNGHKMDYLILMLSFVGWELLSLVTFGILAIYALPYISLTRYQFYLDRIKETLLKERSNNYYDGQII